MIRRDDDPFIDQLQAWAETIGRLGFLSAIVPVFLPFVFGLSIYRARQCKTALEQRRYTSNSRVSDLHWRFRVSATISAVIMFGLTCWASTFIKW